MAVPIPTPHSPEVPLDTEQAAGFYKHRIAMFANVTCLLSLGFVVLPNLIGLVLVPGASPAELLRDQGNRWHVAGVLASFAAGQLVTRGSFGVRALPWLDGAASVVPMALYSVMAHANRYPGTRMEFLALLICMLLQLSRARHDRHRSETANTRRERRSSRSERRARALDIGAQSSYRVHSRCTMRAGPRKKAEVARGLMLAPRR